MHRLLGIPLILLGVFLIADRNNSGVSWVRGAFFPLTRETSKTLRVAAGAVLIVFGISVIIGN